LDARGPIWISRSISCSRRSGITGLTVSTRQTEVVELMADITGASKGVTV